MKRLIVLLTVLTLILSGCQNVAQSGEKAESKSGIAATGIWISYSEINSMLSSENGFEAELLQTVDNCRSLSIENAYIHVRSYCDSLFESEYFPLTEKAQGYNYDVFEKMLSAFHEKGIKVHAWINPYRVYTASTDINVVSYQSPAYKWLKDENTDNDKNVCFWQGIYLNPAEEEVQKLVIDGVREILGKYKVDGIHFDDYFYPTTDPSFDSMSYEAYKAETEKPLSLEDWRRTNVNLLLSGCYNAIKHVSEDILFTVSPAASIDKNYSELYADVESWIKDGYVDWIIPQLYFGFNYSQAEYCFENLLNDWKELASVNTKVQLHIGLASYKIGTENEFDGTEWKTDTDIIARQARLCRDDSLVSGYVLFSYSSVFSSDELNTKQRENYTSALKGEEL